MTLLQVDRQRLDGFYARCLRRVWNIKHAFTSRVSNAAVYEVSEAQLLSDTIRFRQLNLLGRIACESDDNLAHRFIFNSSGITLRSWTSLRKRGRPRIQWMSSNLAFAEHFANSEGKQLHDYIGPNRDPNIWKSFIRQKTFT